MKNEEFKRNLKLFALTAMSLYVNLINAHCFNSFGILNEDEGTIIEDDGTWNTGKRNVVSIGITLNSQYLTIQDSNPVNTITVKITSNETGATVFENVYPQGQTSFIVIPINGWSAGSYTIELFGRENNGYLWGTFQVLP